MNKMNKWTSEQMNKMNKMNKWTNEQMNKEFQQLCYNSVLVGKVNVGGGNLYFLLCSFTFFLLNCLLNVKNRFDSYDSFGRLLNVIWQVELNSKVGSRYCLPKTFRWTLLYFFFKNRFGFQLCCESQPYNSTSVHVHTNKS